MLMEKEKESTKILKIEEGKGFYCLNQNHKKIGEIESNDLFELLKICFECEVLMDKESNDIKNPAEKIVYEEILEQLTKFIHDKTGIKDELNREFSELDSMIYSDTTQ